jgi:hypothetical protein
MTGYVDPNKRDAYNAGRAGRSSIGYVTTFGEQQAYRSGETEREADANRSRQARADFEASISNLEGPILYAAEGLAIGIFMGFKFWHVANPIQGIVIGIGSVVIYAIVIRILARHVKPLFLLYCAASICLWGYLAFWSVGYFGGEPKWQIIGAGIAAAIAALDKARLRDYFA